MDEGVSMSPTDLLDLTTLQNLVDLDDGGHGLLSEMIGIFREDTPRRVEDILAAVEKGNAEELSRAGHALKGGAGALGANALRHLAGELENLGRSGSTEVGPDLSARLNGLLQASLAALDAFVQNLQGN
jgi:HPt (histidine-containing phosphotransfer) domain-containing protein